MGGAADFMSDVINFHATVQKVQTLADGGVRLTLDLPESAIMQAAQLMECKRHGAVLQVGAVPDKFDTLQDNGEW